MSHHVLQNIAADGRVVLHLVVFIGRQATRLQEDAVADRDFADIVQRAGLPQVGEEFLIDDPAELGLFAQFIGENQRIGADPFEMLSGVHVARLSHFGQRVNRDVPCGRKLLVFLPQHFRRVCQFLVPLDGVFSFVCQAAFGGNRLFAELTEQRGAPDDGDRPIDGWISAARDSRHRGDVTNAPAARGKC